MKWPARGNTIVNENGEMACPVEIPSSIRTPTPEAGAHRSTGPEAGKKSWLGSSVYRRTSMAWPSKLDIGLAQIKRLALGNTDLQRH